MQARRSPSRGAGGSGSSRRTAAAKTAPAPARMRVGEVASGFSVMGGIPDIDYLDALGFPEYLHEFRKVSNDPQVAKEITANTLPILSAEWAIEPASDATRDVEIAELVAANLLGETGETFGRSYHQAVSWRARLRDILRFLPNGFAVFQKLYRLEGRHWIFDRLKYLVPESIERFEFDERDNLMRLLRSYTDATGRMRAQERIEARDVVIYTWDQEGSNVLGKPLIRPMWGPYRMKTLLEKLEVVDKQKTAVGIPFFQLQEDPTPEDESRAEQLMKSVRAGNLERIWAVIKHGQEFGWKEGGGAQKGIRAIVEGKEEQIAKVGQATLSELGLAESGSRGTAGAKGAFEADVRAAIAMTVAELEQRNVAELVDMNYDGVEDYPRIVVGKIDPFEKTRNIPEFIQAIAAGAVSADLDTENEIRRRYGFMERSGGSEPPSGPRRDAFEPTGELNADPAEGMARRRRGRGRLGDSSEAVRRAGIDPERLRSRLEAFEAQYLETLRSVLRDMRGAVVEAIARGQVVPEKPADVRVPFQVDLKERLSAILKNVRDFGREELEAEIRRQRESRGSAGRVRLQSDPTSRAGAIAFANERAQVLVELNVADMVSRLQSHVTAEYNRLAAQGLTGDDLFIETLRALEATSEQQIERMARASTAATFNEGRNVAVQELLPGLEPVVVRTAVLDVNTCRRGQEGPGVPVMDRCWELDGLKVQTDSDDYRKFMPPAFCLGHEYCRCLYIAFARS